MSSKDLLNKVRQLNRLLSDDSTGYISFGELCNMIGDMLDSNVYVHSRKGKVLATNDGAGDAMIDIQKGKDGAEYLPESLNKYFLSLKVTQENVQGDDLVEIYGSTYARKDFYHLIIPVAFGGGRVATVVLLRDAEPYTDEDIAISEYGATIIGIEVSRSMANEEEEENRKHAAVQVALDALSYSELDAITKIFGEFEGDEGLLVASKVADKYSITRSVIVNALRKLESAGVIESRSLGMKGTRIKITNEYLRGGIEKIDM